VVDVEDIYDLYSGGIVDEAAIRNYLAYLYERPDVRLSHVLLVGDNEFIPHHISTNTMFAHEVASDFYFSLLDDDNGDNDVDNDDNTPDIVVARLGIKTNDELNQLMTKVKDYETHINEPWQRKVYLTEGFDSSEAHWIGDSFDTINDTYLAPNNIDANMMFRHLLPGESTSLAARYNRENISDGRWITNYAGHGGRGNWQTFTKEDLMQLTNGDKLTIDLNFACDTGWPDDPTYNSLIEDFTLIADKGAIAGLGASRSSTSGDYERVQVKFYKALFESNGGDLGSTITLMKILNNNDWVVKNEVYLLNTDAAIEFIGVQDATVTGAGLRPVNDTARLITGQEGMIWVEVFNRGRAGTSQPVTVTVEVETAYGQFIETHDISVGTLAGRERKVVETALETPGLVAGLYTITATISLDEPENEVSIQNQAGVFTAAITDPPVGTSIEDTNIHTDLHIANHTVTYMDTDGVTWSYDIYSDVTERLVEPFDILGTPTALMDRKGDRVLYQYGLEDGGIFNLSTGTRETFGAIDLMGEPCMGREHAAFIQKDPMGYRLFVINLTDMSQDYLLLQQFNEPLLVCTDEQVIYTGEEAVTFKTQLLSIDIDGSVLGPGTPVTDSTYEVQALAARGDRLAWADDQGIHTKHMISGWSLVISSDGDRALQVLDMSVSETAVAWVDGSDVGLSHTSNVTVYFLENHTTMQPLVL
jgi:hypothetical protein